MKTALFALPLLLIAAPAAAQLRPLVEPPADSEAALAGVDVFLINEGRDSAPIEAPATIQTVARDGTALTLELIRSTADAGPVPAGGFAKLRYRLAPLVQRQVEVAAVEEARGERVTTNAQGPASGFFDRFSPYEPTYGVFGLNDAGGKIQASVALHPFAGRGIASHLGLAYTQTIFWAIQEPSGPIRATTYSPEVFFDFPVGESAKVALGYRHDSNGGGPATSIDVNRFYLRVNKTIPIGGGWRIDIAPQGWFYVGTQGIATDIERFYGYGGLNASIGEQDGLKIALSLRGHPGTQKGAAELFVSYPIRRFGLGDVGLYVFGQAFTGYGEALTDYNIADTHARLGIALTR